MLDQSIKNVKVSQNLKFLLTSEDVCFAVGVILVDFDVKACTSAVGLVLLPTSTGMTK